MTHYLLAVHGPAEMDEFGNYGSKEEMEEAFAATGAFNDRLHAAGYWVFAGGLAPASTAKQQHVTRAAPQRVDAPRPSFAAPSQLRVVPRKARPKHAGAAKRQVVVAPPAPRVVSPAPPPVASAPPPASSEPAVQQGHAHEQQPAKAKPAGKPASQPPAAKSEKPDQEPKPKTDEPGPSADKGQPADPGSQGKANGKNK